MARARSVSRNAARDTEREAKRNVQKSLDRLWSWNGPLPPIDLAISSWRSIEREREREEFPLFPSFLRNAEVAESWDSIVLSMNVDKTPIDNKVKRVECDSPLPPRSPSLGSPAKLGQVLTSKQSDPAIKRWKTGGKACKGKIPPYRLCCSSY